MRALALVLFATSIGSTEQSIVDSITARQLEAHVSFLASDALEGRDTPSKGLEVAGEYIASHFRRFGLKPGGDEGYFQTAPFITVRQPMESFSLTLEHEGKKIAVPSDKCSVTGLTGASVENAELVVVKVASEASALPAREAVEGKPVLLDTGGQRAMWVIRKREQLLGMKPALVLTVGFAGAARARLLAADAPVTSPVITTNEEAVRTLVTQLAATPATVRVTASIQEPVKEPVKLRNVVGVLPGSDPALKDTYVLLSAHYDHVGMSTRLEGDKIFNGANDDSSGTATVLAIAEALSKLPTAPRRTVVFAAWFGEEKGLLGSQFYARHPAFPLAKTVANLNFEHMGRTDDNEGDRTGKLTASGFTYTTLGDVLKAAGEAAGIEAWNDEKNSDAFFARSDNQALADAGIPAITVAAVWIFPDYHRPSDHWDKLNYPNFEKVARTAALAAFRVADNPEPPKWNETNPKVTRYVQAWKTLNGAH